MTASHITRSRRRFISALGRVGFLGLFTPAVRAKEATTSEEPCLRPAPDTLPFDGDYLAEWKAAPRITLTESDNPESQWWIDAISEKDPVQAFYYGGSMPGVRRSIQPLRIFRVQGFRGVYCEALCLAQNEVRTFNLAKLSLKPWVA